MFRWVNRCGIPAGLGVKKSLPSSTQGEAALFSLASPIIKFTLSTSPNILFVNKILLYLSNFIF
jgi:hypothetical protein